MAGGKWEQSGFRMAQKFHTESEMDHIWARCSVRTLNIFNVRASCERVSQFIDLKELKELPIVALRDLIAHFYEQQDVRSVIGFLRRNHRYIALDDFFTKLELATEKAELSKRFQGIHDRNFSLVDLRALEFIMIRELEQKYPPERIISLVDDKDIGVCERIPGRPSLRELTANALAHEMSTMTAQQMQVKFNFNADLDVDFIFGNRIRDTHRFELQMLVTEMMDMEMRRLELPQPRVISLTNIETLNRRDYSVSWLSSGAQRCLMLLTEESCFIVNNVLDMRHVEVDFPIEVREKNTLVAAEIVIDNISFEKGMRLFISDIYVLNGDYVLDLSFEKRNKLIDDRLIRPYRQLMSRLNHGQRAPFKISRKYFWPAGEMDYMIERFMPTLKHNTEGLLFRKTKARGLGEELQFRITR